MVIDASVLVKWFVEEEGSKDARALRGRALMAPDLVIVETANVLWKKVRVGSFDAGYVGPALEALARAGLQITPSLALAERAIQIALALDHAVYDCFYLALAELYQVAFVSVDDRLARKLASRTEASTARVVTLADAART